MNLKSVLYKIAFFILFVFVVFLSPPLITEVNAKTWSADTYFKIGDVELLVEVEDTPEGRAQGLGFRDNIPHRAGMLFVFEREGAYSFWMKDTFVDIDIIWLSKDRKILHIEKEVTPETYPTVFSPNVLAKYVLEVKGGFSDKYGLALNDKASFEL